MRLTSYGLSVDNVAAALRQAPFDVPAGSFRSAEQQLIVRADAMGSLEAIRDSVRKITREDGKVSIIAGVTKAETDRIRAGDLANHVAEQCGGRGGGRPDMAQAGGNQPEKLADALESVPSWVESRL